MDFQLSTGRMPRRDKSPKRQPYSAIIPRADIKALDTYVTALVAHGGPGIPKVDTAKGNVADGGDVFRQYCAACHSLLGRGGELIDRPIPTLTEATPKEIGEAIRAGAYQMPKFGTAAISAHELNSIAAYIHYLQHPRDNGGDTLSHLGPVAEGFVTFFVVMVLLLGFTRWIGQRG